YEPTKNSKSKLSPAMRSYRMNPKWNRKTVHNESDEWINWSVYWFNIDNDVNGILNFSQVSKFVRHADFFILSGLQHSNLKWKVVILGYQDKFRGSLPEWDSVPGQWDILLTLSRNQRGFHSVAPSNKFNQHLARVNIDSDSTSF
ncbi:unnamed protein product, partial [Nesidiocoris tenuis]